ncbi:hypothetical protein JKA74_13630 [Marivirga sp. S37H4]|uniref:Uncharacterized protein n=1 Tax=Marivirga aurantiaca TaxID=2802615 RepID=A0A935C9N2_9BACT|nr:hypothetical protein [Marivirga aurantiaca]MBK6266079.1 hypothetical protein [Marivirga aurantiaca]
MVLEKYLPEYQFNEVHKIVVEGSTEDCYKASMNLDLSKSGIIAFLFRLRGLPFSNTHLAALTKDMRFTLLEEIQYTEFLYAFWFKSQPEWITDKEEFMRGSSCYNAKVGWSFNFVEKGNGKTEIITETRVFCLNRKTKLLFSIYWFFIRPFSGLIRIQMLRLIKKELEK